MDEATHGSMNLSETRFECDFAVELPYEPESTARISISANNNRFDCEEAALAVYGFAPQELGTISSSELPFSWQGINNEMPDTSILLFSADEQQQAPRALPE